MYLFEQNVLQWVTSATEQQSGVEKLPRLPFSREKAGGLTARVISIYPRPAPS